MSGTIQYQGVEIEYDYMPEQPEVPISMDNAGGEPGWPAWLEITAAEVVDPRSWMQETGGMDLPDDPLEWAREDWMVEDMCWEHAREIRP